MKKILVLGSTGQLGTALKNDLTKWCEVTFLNRNDLDFTIDNQTDGGTFNSVQDGQDNDIDFDIVSMDNFIIDIDQIGNNNTLDIDVDGRTSDGSSITIIQTGNSNSYSGNLYCGHTYCSMTLNQ